MNIGRNSKVLKVSEFVLSCSSNLLSFCAKIIFAVNSTSPIFKVLGFVFCGKACHSNQAKQAAHNKFSHNRSYAAGRAIARLC